MSRRSFWDTNLFIYWLEHAERFEAAMDRLQEWHAKERLEVITSTLTLAEILVHPIAEGQPLLAQKYHQTIQRMGCIPFGPEAAWRFAEIRAAHPKIKPPDAIQLACAATEQVHCFITHDEELVKLSIEGIVEIHSLTEWLD